MVKRTFTRTQQIERSLVTDFRYPIWRKFTRAIDEYQLLAPNDKVCVCISGGKDSMLLALLFKHLHRYSKYPFEVRYLVMNPGYNQKNLDLILQNLKTLDIPATVVETDIFEIANQQTESPCYLCAKMRRGALYRIAKSWGCNKIALGHHYDDVIETTLMNLLNAGSFQTMLPKLHSDHYSGMELIRPLYLVREADIIAFAKQNALTFIRCACRFTEEASSHAESSKRLQTKLLIQELKEKYSPYIEKNIFQSASNVSKDMILGYKDEEGFHSFLDDYEAKGKALDEKIKASGIEEQALAKAEREHRPLKIEETKE